MSAFKDILDTIQSLDGEMVQYILHGKRQRSLSKSAQEGILNFPVLISDSLTIEDASLISKALEKEFASFTLTVMTMNPYLYTSGAPNASNYIKQFHQNIDVKADSTDIANVVTSFMNEAATLLGVDYDTISVANEQIAYHIYEGVNHSGMNKENMKFNYSVTEIADPRIINTFNRKAIVLEADNGKGKGKGGNGKPRTTSQTYSASGDMNITNSGDVTYSGDITVRGGLDSREVGKAIGKTAGRATTNIGQSRDVKMMMDNDYKKANELVPTLIHIRIFPVDKTNDVDLQPIDFVLGVKATLHPIPSEEMIVNIVRGIKNDDGVFNFVRWTTGEIKFFKDFVLTVNDLKIDAINTSSKASRWWTMLKRRKNLARIKNNILPQRLLPNATIVITQEEVDILKEQYGYNLTNAALVDKLMKAYYLIAFVIVDPALQRVKFLFDGKSEYDTLTYATLAREATTNDKQFKEMVNMLGRRL